MKSGLEKLLERRRRQEQEDLLLREQGEKSGIVHIEHGEDIVTVQPDWAEWKQKTAEHLHDTIDTFNRLLKAENYPVYLDATKSIQQVLKSQLRGCDQVQAYMKTRPGCADPKSGILYPNNVENLIGRLLPRFMEDGRTLNVLGATQSGKTTQNVAMLFLGPIIYVLTAAEYFKNPANGLPIVYYPILFTPNRISLEKESDVALKNLFDLYGDLEIVSSDGSVVTTANKHLVEQYAVLLDNDNLGIKFDVYEEGVLQRGEEEIAQGVRRGKKNGAMKTSKKESKKEMEDVRDYLQKILNANDKIVKNVQREFLLIFDESDHGDRKDSLTNYFVGLKLTYKGRSRSILDISIDRNSESRMVLPSATPYAFMAKEVDVHQVSLKIGEGYHGPNCHGGKPIDPTVTTTMPDIVSASEITEYVGDGDGFFPYIKGNLFHARRFHTRRQRFLGRLIRDGADPNRISQIRAITSEEYDDVCADSLAEVIRFCVREGDSVVIRFHHHGNPTRAMVEALNERIGDAVEIGIWDSDSEHETASKFFEDGWKTGKPVVQFVIGKARRGDPYPPEVRYFINFTDKSGNMTTVEQDLLGRACGYNKFDKNRIHPLTGKQGFGNIVLLNDREAAIVHEWIASQGVYNMTPKRLSYTAVAGEKQDKLREFVMIREDLTSEIDSEMVRWNAIFTKMLDHDHIANKGKTLVQLPAKKLIGVPGILVSDGKAYVQIWHDGLDLRSHIASNPTVCDELMGVSTLHMFDYRDVENKTMSSVREIKPVVDRAGNPVISKKTGKPKMQSVKISGIDPYWLHSEVPQYAHITFHWAKTDSMRHRGSRNNGGLDDEIDVTPRGQRGFTPRSKNRPDHFEEVAAHVVRVDAQGNVVDTFAAGVRWKLIGVVFKCKKPTDAVRTHREVVAVIDQDCLASGMSKAADAGN